MDAQQIRVSMRAKLQALGLTPTERGEELMRRGQSKYRQRTHDAIDKLEPRDLFSIWLIAGELTRADEPPAQKAR